ncbi:hypothetical protein ACSQ76_18045 [Roseovarius sp. B08]|uniref:hypothetical protein n=1 Tax=Roseovarius sp. B08 TaxID=3449223 RepID=UPI003EDC9527
MDRSIPMLLIGLVFGGGIGFTVAAANGVALDGHDHGDPAHHGGHEQHAGAAMHDHGDMLSVPAGADAPKLEIEVTPDPSAGWNLHIMTENFRFSPENASRDHVPGEGHAHVYANGVKLARVYGPWVHLDTLPEGEVELEVALNSNDHRPLAVDGAPVAQTVTLGN